LSTSLSYYYTEEKVFTTSQPKMRESKIIIWGVELVIKYNPTLKDYGSVKQLEAPSNVIAITAGQNHATFLTDRGQVFVFGSYDGEELTNPRLVLSLTDDYIIKIITGHSHDMAITSKLYLQPINCDR
jgi:alpha-tubulin suppressor-like RCC1 family protein